MSTEEKKVKSGKGQIVAGAILICIAVVAVIIGFITMSGGENSDSLKETAKAFDPDSSAEEMQYVEMSMITDVFATFDGGEGQGFCIAFNEDGSAYIVCMSDEEFGEHKALYDYYLSGDGSAPLPKAERAYGYPVEIDQELSGFIADYIKELYADSEISESDIQDFVGTYYLDTTYRLSTDSSLMVACFVVGGLLAFIGILLLVTKKKQGQSEENSQSFLEYTLGDTETTESGYKKPVLEEKQLNHGLGILGAILGSLAGAVVWAVMYQLGYLVGIAGYLSVACAIFCYKKLAGGINRSGIILCTIISLLMLCGANVFACSWAIVSEVNAQNPGRISLGYVLTNFFTLMDDSDAWPSFFGDLAIGLVLALFAMYSPLKNAMGKKKKEK